MKKIPFLTVLIILIFTFNSYSQDSNIGFGLKAGANYSKFTPDLRIAGFDYLEYKRKFGFYVGGFLTVGISENIRFQPELLFALQGTRTLIEDIEITGTGGDVTVSDLRSRINELTIVVPLVFRYFFTESLFLDGGPQLGFIVDRNEKITEDPFYYETPQEPIEYEYDKFDMGLTIGTGYNLSENLTLSGRFFFGLIERDHINKSSVFNLGLEYNM